MPFELINPAVFSLQNNHFVTFLASFLIWFMFAALFYLWLFDGKLKKNQVLHVVLASMTAWIITQFIKGAIPIDRPFEVNQAPPLTVTIPQDNAFPSTHSAVAFALASGVWVHHRKAGVVFAIASVFVALGRIFGNVHTLMDVFVGAGLGGLSSVVFYKFKIYKFLR